MFCTFAEFTSYLEALPSQEVTFQEREHLLQKGRQLLETHGLIPHIPIITVTGTNGKGSTVQALAEILVHYHFNVFTFTSPHLMSYTERFAYNLQFIDEETILRIANQLAQKIDLSRWNFFFILFFIHLWICKESQVDYLIIEVGIGGRLDPSNMLDASLVILTQVALDHTPILGDTRETIGFEKSALVREGIPFICGDPNPPITVLEKAKASHCLFYQLHQHFGFVVRGNAWDVWFKDQMLCDIPPPIMHLNSLCCALQAVKCLMPYIYFTQALMQTILPKIVLPARYQYFFYHDTEIVIDVSHNPAAVEALANFLTLLPPKPLYAIFSAKPSKDIDGIICLMKNLVEKWYVVPLEFPHHKHEMKTHLLSFFEALSIQIEIASSVEKAIQMILEKKLTNARVVIFGSFRVAGPALQFFQSYA